jgi:hypothetical protein
LGTRAPCVEPLLASHTGASSLHFGPSAIAVPISSSRRRRMAATIHALPTAREPQRACAECKFFTPDVNLFGGYEPRSVWDWLMGRPRVPSARAKQYAVCTALGGNLASWCRDYRCKGEMWKPNT